jgi:hypothetical protein
MASEATPRISAKYLNPFINQTVRILGKVVSLRGETAVVDANGPITIFLNRVRTHPPPPSSCFFCFPQAMMKSPWKEDSGDGGGIEEGGLLREIVFENLGT